MKIGTAFLWQQRLGAANQDDAGGVDIRRWKKAAGGDLKRIARFKVELDEQGQEAVIVVIGAGHQAAGDFKLEGGDDALRGTFALGEFDENGGGDGIGEVGDEFPIAPIVGLAFEEFEGVVVE